MKRKNVIIGVVIVLLIISSLFVFKQINLQTTPSVSNEDVLASNGDIHKDDGVNSKKYVIDYDIAEKEQEEKQRTKEVIDMMKQKIRENPEYRLNLRFAESFKIGKYRQLDTIEEAAKIEEVPKRVQYEQYNGIVNESKLLVVLMEFPDYNHNRIKPEYTEFYYEDYSKEHYENLLFSKKGFKGPNGENLMSLRQYYMEQSGGSLDFSGGISGWYTAEHGYAYYGAPLSEQALAQDNYANIEKLVKQAIDSAAKDPNIDLSEYDKQDIDDCDDDGNYNEPDGYIDHLAIVYSGIGQSDGGGELGKDAIWPIAGSLFEPYEVTDSKGNTYGVTRYIMLPEETGIGTFVHEIGHSLGLPDLYDLKKNCVGNPVALWALMGKGGRNGVIWNTQPAAFNAWSKLYLQRKFGGNWISGTEIDLEDIPKDGLELLLDESNARGVNNDVVRINLPDQSIKITEPTSGNYVYSPDFRNNIRSSMSIKLDLSETVAPELTFQTWFQLDYGYDFFYVKVRPEGEDEWQNIEGNLTSSIDFFGFNEQNSIGSKSKQSTVGYWKTGEFLLEEFAGKRIELMIEAIKFRGDESKLFIDDIEVADNGKTLFSDDAEAESQFYLNGFEKNNGEIYVPRFYLLEWRNHSGTDEGLAHTMHNTVRYEPGLLIWYVDENYKRNFAGDHPGEGLIGLIDADQNAIMKQELDDEKPDIQEVYDTKFEASYYNMHDAAFGLREHSPLEVIVESENVKVIDNDITPNSVFDDSQDYSNSFLPELGRNIPEYGLRIEVIEENEDRSIGKIRITLEE